MNDTTDCKDTVRLSSTRISELVREDPVFGEAVQADWHRIWAWTAQAAQTGVLTLKPVLKLKSVGDDLYRVRLTPELSKRMSQDLAKPMHNGKTGLWNGGVVNSKSGRLEGRAGFEKTGSSFNSLGAFSEAANQVASELAGMVQLAEITRQLDQIEGKVDDVIKGQQNDRRAEIQAGIDQYNATRELKDENNRAASLRNAAHSIYSGRAKVMGELREKCNIIPENPGIWDYIVGVFGVDRALGRTYEQVKQELPEIEDCIKHITRADGYLQRIYYLLGEPEVARSKATSHHDMSTLLMEKSGPDSLLPPKLNAWGRQFETTYTQLADHRDPAEGQIVLEFTAKEAKEINDGNML